MVSFTATGISPLVDSQTLGTGPYQLGSFVEEGQFKNLFVDVIEDMEIILAHAEGCTDYPPG